MQQLYVFANEKYFGHFVTNSEPAKLRESIEINNGFDEGSVTTWKHPENLTLEDFQKDVIPGKEELVVVEGEIQVVNTHESNELVDEYNDQDTGTENMPSEYVRTILRRFPLEKVI